MLYVHREYTGKNIAIIQIMISQKKANLQPWPLANLQHWPLANHNPSFSNVLIHFSFRQ